jgi:predicted nucleic acid-binding protein
MRILIDCDVLLDVALQRRLHFKASAEILDWAERNPGHAAVAWHTLSNLHYLCPGGARKFIEDLLQFVEIPRTGSERMRQAVALPMKDLEDAMQSVAAEEFGAQVIATRNVSDFSLSPIHAIIPNELAPILRERG